MLEAVVAVHMVVEPLERVVQVVVVLARLVIPQLRRLLEQQILVVGEVVQQVQPLLLQVPQAAQALSFSNTQSLYPQ